MTATIWVMEIVEASGAERIAAVRDLFEEYWKSFGFTPCFQGFGDELEKLPGEYAPPGGALLIAEEDGAVAGCVAVRRVDETRCEAKRLYVRPAFRGKGTGLALLEAAMNRAREMGYRQVVGDTMPVMADALRMYERMGFERIEPYLKEPTPGAICIGLKL